MHTDAHCRSHKHGRWASIQSRESNEDNGAAKDHSVIVTLSYLTAHFFQECYRKTARKIERRDEKKENRVKGEKKEGGPGKEEIGDREEEARRRGVQGILELLNKRILVANSGLALWQFNRSAVDTGLSPCPSRRPCRRPCHRPCRQRRCRAYRRAPACSRPCRRDPCRGRRRRAAGQQAVPCPVVPVAAAPVLRSDPSSGRLPAHPSGTFVRRRRWWRPMNEEKWKEARGEDFSTFFKNSCA